MSLLEKILKWTEKLPLWQRDATRRLFQQDGRLSEQDINELLAILKQEHGIQPKTQIVAIPLSKEHMPVATRQGNKVLLTSMHSLNHVNRLPSDQVLNFASQGLTVIYGGNGSGKSGYARVLKRACRARDAENVLPNMNHPNADSCIPQAAFEITVNDQPQTVSWIRADPHTPEELSAIAVFDSHCARAYLTEDNDVAYLPYGLDILENLANRLIPELSRRLDEEITEINDSRSPFSHLEGNTKVGKIIATLDASTDLNELGVLGNLSDQELKHLADVGEALKQPDPLTKAKEHYQYYQELKELATKIDALARVVGDDTVLKFQNLDHSVLIADQAVQLASEKLRSNENLLPGTGNLAWRELFEAARRFAENGVDSETKFPPADADAVCPLCQEPLRNGAERLKRFDEFIKTDAAKKLSEAMELLKREKSRVQAIPLKIDLGKPLEDRFTSIDELLVSEIRQFEKELNQRKDLLIEALHSHQWNEITKTSKLLYDRIRKLAAKHCREAHLLRKVSDPQKIENMKMEFRELEARRILSEVLESIITLIQRMKEKSSLLLCKKALTTANISKKSKELASESVTAELKQALDLEFQKFGISHINTKLNEKNEKGKTKHRLLLDFPTKVNLEHILSEGEQRALALASFLAELNLTHHEGGIVFDDPVSSLDHWRREKVAKRFIEEARKRQVIIFTHDTVFLGELTEHEDVKNGSMPMTVNYLEWNSNAPGFVNEGLPWEHKSIKDRIDRFEKKQREMARNWGDYPSEEMQGEMRVQYSRLRATIERVVQDEVFCGVICRYRDWINMPYLRGVIGFCQSEHDKIDALHKRTCDVTEAHDTASGRLQTIPTPQEFLKDIEDLREIIEIAKIRKSASKKK